MDQLTVRLLKPLRYFARAHNARVPCLFNKQASVGRGNVVELGEERQFHLGEDTVLARSFQYYNEELFFLVSDLDNTELCEVIDQALA